MQITVSGFDTASIHAARDAAGPNGKLFFPSGTYDTNGLTASVPNQTWEGERGVVLLRNASAAGDVLDQTAPGLWLFNLTLDGNRQNNSQPGNGIVHAVQGLSLRMERCTIQNMVNYGIASQAADIELNDCTIQDTTVSCILWQHTGTTLLKAPKLRRCVFDRSRENPATIQLSNILIQASTSAQLAVRPRIQECDSFLPVTSKDAVEHIELVNCQRGWVTNNFFMGGEMGCSNGSSYMSVTGNISWATSTYAIEVGGSDSIYFGNLGSGYAPSRWGIFVNPAALSSAVIGNHYTGMNDANVANQAGSQCTTANNW